jgi:DNA replication licensing factor MCM6
MVREAYTLLRQSIIHIEQDDIDFDEEELRGEREENGPAAGESEETGTGEREEPTSPTRAGGSGAQLMDSPTKAAPKKKTKITHDKYMAMQSLIVLHLSEVERTTGSGLEREDLIDWYLEQKENELNSIEELEAEKDLVGKVLKKLVKVSGLIYAFWRDNEFAF